jgi:DNA invertase Pin-like site-specific DNA recombinase
MARVAYRIKQIEKQWDEAAESLILRMLNDEGMSLPEVADKLDMTLQTLTRWCRRNGIVKQITWKKLNTQPDMTEKAHESA